MLVGEQLGNREHDPQPPSHQCPSPPQQCPRGGLQAPGLHWQLGLKEPWESKEVLRFALCFSFQPQLVPGFVISKCDQAPDGRKLAGAQSAGPQPWDLSANSPLETGQLTLRVGQAGRGLTPPTLDPGGAPV